MTSQRRRWRRFRLTDTGAETAWKWACRTIGLAGFVYLLIVRPEAPPQAWVATAGIGGFGDVVAANIRYKRKDREG